MPNEADRKRELVKAVKALGGAARRVEDAWAVGVLDLAIKLPGVPFIWAEGKIIKLGRQTSYTEGFVRDGAAHLAVHSTAIFSMIGEAPKAK